MEAAVLESPGRLVIKKVAKPVCPPGGLIVRTHACSICSSDGRIFRWGHPALSYPCILGHEVAGVVVESCTGRFKEGDRVQLFPGICCGKCPACRRGADNQCDDIRIIGFNYDGGFAQYLAVPERSVIGGGVNLLPQGLSYEEASLAEPLASCLNGQELANVTGGETVLILGGGPIGLLHAMLARVRGSIEKAGIGIFNGMSAKVHPQALFRILSQIRFGTTLNIAGSLSNPALPRYAVRGVYSETLVEGVARVMREIGYLRALVVYGRAGNGLGMDEVSTLGETVIAELSENGSITTCTVNPEDFGIKRPDEQALRPAQDPGAEALAFLKTLAGSDQGPRCDIVRLNAAAIFYLMGRAKDIREGLGLAREVIRSGGAIAKLREWVSAQNTDPASGLKKLEGLLAQAMAQDTPVA